MTKKESKKEELAENEIQHKKLNDGMKFTIPEWSYGKHKRVVKRLACAEKERKESGGVLADSERQRLLENFIIMESLTEADVDINEDIIDTLHPNDRLELYMTCYMCGRKGLKGDALNFRQSKPVTQEISNE